LIHRLHFTSWMQEVLQTDIQNKQDLAALRFGIKHTMNCREHQLPELELSTGQVREVIFNCCRVTRTPTLWLWRKGFLFPIETCSHVLSRLFLGSSVYTPYDSFVSERFDVNSSIGLDSRLLLPHVALIVMKTCSLRSPGPVTPRDVECEGFSLAYTRIAGGSTNSAISTDVDQKVDDAIEAFLRTLSQIIIRLAHTELF
jgi:hypothetical protein